jgi:DNA polymerase IV (DinB-like DNA polymerase)
LRVVDDRKGGMSGGETLLGATGDTDAAERIVCHVDMDCFYASCERLRDPDLRGDPVVVGMGYEPGESHGAVATASYEARAYGVESAQPISQALELLPRVEAAREEPALDAEKAGHYRPVDMDHYRGVAERIRSVLRECADRLREVSIDEAYLDVSDRTAWTVVDGRTLAEGYARHIKARIDREVGVPASVGVAPTMSAAKVASDHDKPNGLVVVEPGEVGEFFAPLSVEEVHGVGPVTARKLGEMGIETAGELAETNPQRLHDRFGERGRTFYDRARGDDDREVTPMGRPKSFSRESAFPEATVDADRQREAVAGLAADVADRADREGALYRTIGIKVVTPPYDMNTRERSLPGPVAAPGLVEEVALDLLAEFAGDPVRKVGVRVSNLRFDAGEQAQLDGWKSDRGRNAPGATPDDNTVGWIDDEQSLLTDFDG